MMKRSKTKLVVVGSLIIICLLCIWLTASLALTSQASNVIYEEDKSLNLTINANFTSYFVLNREGNQLDFMEVAVTDSPFWILYLHGTWGRLSYIIEGVSEYANILSVSAPGFSASQGKSDTGLINEAAELGLQELNKKGIANENIIVLGHSMGGSPALFLASKYSNLKAVAIVNTFYSMQRMCQMSYSILCVFSGSIHPSNIYASNALSPIIHMHSPQDEMIPIQQGRDLHQLIPTRKQFVEIKGSHGEFEVDQVMGVIREFTQIEEWRL